MFILSVFSSFLFRVFRVFRGSLNLVAAEGRAESFVVPIYLSVIFLPLIFLSFVNRGMNRQSDLRNSKFLLAV